jgi:hypothetical protein
MVSVFQGFLLGLMVSWLPGLIFLGCIAVGKSPEERQHQHLHSGAQLNA